MTKRNTLKRRIRARMSETGETYSTARRHFHVYERNQAMCQQLIDKCAEGDIAAVKALISNGVDVNFRGDPWQYTLGIQCLQRPTTKSSSTCWMPERTPILPRTMDGVRWALAV